MHTNQIPGYASGYNDDEDGNDDDDDNDDVDCVRCW